MLMGRTCGIANSGTGSPLTSLHSPPTVPVMTSAVQGRSCSGLIRCRVGAAATVQQIAGEDSAQVEMLQTTRWSVPMEREHETADRKSTRLNSSHVAISY